MDQRLGETDEQRTTPIGLFNFAESYWQAAVALDKAKLTSTHPHSPVSFLYYHAIELYLKSFLRLHGHTPSELQQKFGHSTRRLKNRAAKLGLTFDDEDITVLSKMSKSDVLIRARYIQTGPICDWPALEALNRTCRSLRQLVGAELRKQGIHVRL